MLDLRWAMWSFYFPYENIYSYMQFEGIEYQQIVGITIGTNCVPLIVTSNCN